jgi:prepilin-type N-terminal cleavage/methylation domain-containing protein
MTAQFKKGFTLIELLIVMAVIGVLAVVVLVAINPVQQLARTRDTGRKSAVTQMGHALSAYYTSRSGTEYVAASSSWIDDLATAGEIATIPSQLEYSANPGVECSTNVQNYYCYDYNVASVGAITFARLESDSEEAKCSGTDEPYFVWDSVLGRAGLVCMTAATEPSYDVNGQTFTD